MDKLRALQYFTTAAVRECIWRVERRSKRRTFPTVNAPTESPGRFGKDLGEVAPDIVVAHVETPTATSVLGAKGAGEAGTAGAPAAVMNAINDALAPLSAQVFSQPCTPEKILRALGKVA